jgi:hypothetical protein
LAALRNAVKFWIAVWNSSFAARFSASGNFPPKLLARPSEFVSLNRAASLGIQKTTLNGMELPALDPEPYWYGSLNPTS